MFGELLDALTSYSKEGLEGLVISEMTLEKGLYIIAKKDNDTYKFDRHSLLKVNNNTKDREKLANSLYKKYSQLDLLNKYLSNNKSLSDKNISSVTPYSFFIKRDKLLNMIDTNDYRLIDKQFNKLCYMGEGFNSREKVEAYNSYVNGINYECPKELILKICDWLKCNLVLIRDIIEDAHKGDYIKIYFEADEADMVKEYGRYFAAYGFLDNKFNKYCTADNGKSITYGIPSAFNSMNLTKKPYKINLTRPCSQPFLVDTETNKKIYNVMKILESNSNKPYVFMEEDKFNAGKYTLRNNRISSQGYFIKTAKEKSLKLLDWDVITTTQDYQEFPIKRFIESKYDKINYNTVYHSGNREVVNRSLDTNKSSNYKNERMGKENYDVYSLAQLIDTTFFSGRLLENFYNDIDKVKKSCKLLPEETVSNIIKYRKRFLNWFVKNMDVDELSLFDDMSKDIILKNINKRPAAAVKQLNLRLSLMSKWRNREFMYSKELSNNLYEKVNSGDGKIDNEYEFAYSMGQVLSYALNVPNLSNNYYRNINFESDDVEVFLAPIIRVYNKYHQNMDCNRYFKEILKYILEYRKTELKAFDKDAFLQGYLSRNENVMYRKAPEKKKSVNKDDVEGTDMK